MSRAVALWPFYLFYGLLTLLVSGHIFFWDTVQLGAKHAMFYYETGFGSPLLPDDIDSGHIAAFGAYLAGVWHVFGKSLLVSHLSMLPFLCGIVFQARALLEQYVRPQRVYPALVLFLADATLLGQSALVSPDVVLVFFFLWGLNAVLSQDRLSLSAAAAGLVLTSMRGMMVALALVLIDVLLHVRIDGAKSLLRQLLIKSLAYLPAFFVFAAYNLYHYAEKGWIGYHADSPWAPSFQRADAAGMAFNAGLLGWRLLDFGRVFLWAAVLGIAWKHGRSLLMDGKVRQMVLIFAVLLACLSVSFLSYTSLNAHRYLLPAYLAFALLAVYLVSEKIASAARRRVAFAALLLGLLGGNLWIYPEKVSQGWDSSLAHLHYYGLRERMLGYMAQEGIGIAEVACVFPNTAELRFMDLSERREQHLPKDLDTNVYVLYSNVYNDYTNEETDRLRAEFVPLKEFEQMGVFLRLYKRKALE